MSPRNLTALFVALALGAYATAAGPMDGELHCSAGARLFFDETTGEVTKRVDIPSFPAALGRLEGVRIELKLEASSTYCLENLGKTDAPVEVLLNEGFGVFRSGAGYLVGTTVDLAREHDLEPFDGKGDFQGPSGHTEKISVQKSVTVVLPPDLGWTDLGAGEHVSLDLRGELVHFELDTDFDSEGDLTSELEGQATLRVEVTYLYR